MQKHFSSFFVTFLTLCIPFSALGQVEDYTYNLTQSNGSYQFWTTLPAEKVFKDDIVPTDTGSEVKLYAAKNEFEPFQVIVKPTSSGSANVNIGDFGSGITSEIYQVKYVNLTTASDYLGRTGDNPDPLWPVDKGASVSLTANENTPLWFSFKIDTTATAGDHVANVTIGGVDIPVRLHVFDFNLPGEIHIESYVHNDYNAIYNRYAAATNTQRLLYRNKFSQFMIDHRISPRLPFSPGGMLSAQGASPNIDYACPTDTFSDPYSEYNGFETAADKYLKGIGFNDGNGFAAFQVAGYKTTDSDAEQRNLICSLTPSGWTIGSGPYSSGFNEKWFEEYIPAVRDYLNNLGVLNSAYYNINDEPASQSDYDSIIWYSKELKRVAPDLRLMVNEEPKPDIFDDPDYSDGNIDIWDTHFGTDHFDPEVSLDRLRKGETTWLYFLHNTYPPFFNPITIDHDGIESIFLGWFLWKYRIRGFEYWLFNDWSPNPWTSPMYEGMNGDAFLIYPPKDDNTPLSSYDINNRFVSSIRFELMRDGIESYEYFYLLNGGSRPGPDDVSPADEYVGRIIKGMTAYTYDAQFLYNLRRVIGEKISNAGYVIPDIQPIKVHSRSNGTPGDYYINFQGTNPIATQNWEGNDYTYKIGAEAYSLATGYGWRYAEDGAIMTDWDEWTNGNPTGLWGSIIYDYNGRHNTFEFDLPNGTYNVTVASGYRGGSSSDEQKIIIDGVTFFDGEVTAQGGYLTATNQVVVNNKKLSLEMGQFEKTPYINFMKIEAVSMPPAAAFGADVTSGYTPLLTVSFTDLSTNNPTSRQWDFDNNGSIDSTEQNPSHDYTSQGIYSVKLTSTNTYGSDTETKTDYIKVFGYHYVDPCACIVSPCTGSINAAIAAISGPTAIHAAGKIFSENISLNGGELIILKGGWDSQCTDDVDYTTIISPAPNSPTLTIQGATLTVENIILN